MAKNSVKSSKSSFSDAFKFGLGAGLGAGLSTILFIFIGMLFFIPGVYLYKEEQKKPKDKRDDTRIIGSYILMGLGVVIGLGMGASFFFESIFEE